ncbi:voltage-gated ion channel superfamily [Stylonychia lemnae]|uniref:Voltage-gated ion channel superfamily n=1 Tax=Stylonychia lemnae TaxID=5949 RepID=A0A078AHF7_STYLE|nr:voltage-gated ion channel superfamily [Stylonychia lemnae]|eukprot:CDW81684.1 voltage-gated ion channel superfamily [Stylonychia lemnae]
MTDYLDFNDAAQKEFQRTGNYKKRQQTLKDQQKREENPPTLVTIPGFETEWFDRLIMLAIVINSICLSLFDYMDREVNTQYNLILNWIGDGFTLFFLFEALIKVFAMGFIIHKKAYLRDGLLDLVATSVNLKSLRTLRVLRPLKSINAIPSMRRLVSTLFQSLPELGNATIFLSFMIILFGILGLQQFSGIIYYKCRLTAVPINENYWPKSPIYNRVCSQSTDGGYQCPDNLYCGSPLDVGISLDDDGVYYDKKIQFGISSFDNFGQAVLGVFQIITKDQWTELMYNLQDGSNSIFARIYCSTIIVLGSYFLLNLILAVIMSNFTRIYQIDQEKELIEKEKVFKTDKKIKYENLTTQEILNMSSSDDDNIIENFETQQTQKDIQKAQQMDEQRNQITLEVEQLDRNVQDEEIKDTTPNNRGSLVKSSLMSDLVQEDDAVTPQSNLSKIKTFSKPIPDSPMGFGLDIIQKQMTAQDPQSISRTTTSMRKFQEIEEQMHETEAIDDINLRLKLQQAMFEQQEKILRKMEYDIKKKYAMKQEWEKRVLDEAPKDSEAKKMLKQRELDEVEKEIDQVSIMSLKISANLKQINLKDHLQKLILNKFKSQLIQKNILEKMFTKVENQMTKNILQMRANKFFLFKCFFGLELLLKMAGLGFVYYFRDKFNWFDSLVVFVSMLDLTLQYTSIIKDISNISILLFLFIYTYTLLGLELFAFKVKFDESNRPSFGPNSDYPQSTFNTFMEAFISVFIVLTNDGWTPIYFDHYRASDSTTSSFYFITLLIIGQFILLNLFISILIENFEQVSVHQDTVNKLKQQSSGSRIKILLRKLYFKLSCKQYEEEDTSEEAKSFKIKQDKLEQKRPSLQIFQPKNKFRRFCKKYCKHKNFEGLMLFIILISSIQLAVDNPLNDPDAILSKILSNLDIALTVAFTIEAIISFTISSKNINSIKILRLLKVLRPLRVISRNQGLKISIRSLAVSIPGILNVGIISLIFYLIFGIIGVNYFKGRYYFCDMDHVPRGKQILKMIDTKWDCLCLGGEWNNYFQNFDDAWMAMSSLFMISTTVDWAQLMYRGVANRGYDMAPKNLENFGLTFFFVAFMIVANFFLLNLFVGVVISTYNREKETLGRNFLLTEKQRKWLENKIMMVQSKPMLMMKLPQSEWRQPFFKLAQFVWFERFIYFCIIANTVILAIQWQNQPVILDLITEKFNYAFAGIFTFEVIVKFIAYGKRYFKDGWNNFDIVIVVMTLISIILASTTSYQLGPQTTIIRSFRIGRIFKLFRRNKSLKSIFQTFLVTLPAMANVGSLLILFIFIYSILGVYMFADIRLNGELNHNANFQNVSNAFLLLIRISTGGNWSKLMYSLQKASNLQYQCIQDPTFKDYKNAGSCGGLVFPYIYFFSYILLVDLIYLKLFIAIILQGFQDTTERDNKLLDQDASDKFREVWSHFDPDATTFMRAQSYGQFLALLGEPLGWDDTFDFNYLKQINYLDEVNLPKYNAHTDYQFMDVFESLALLMIVKKEVRKYLIKYTKKIQMIRKKQMLSAEKQRQQKQRKKAKQRKPQNQQSSNHINVMIRQSSGRGEKFQRQSSNKSSKELKIKNSRRGPSNNETGDKSQLQAQISLKKNQRQDMDELLFQEADRHNDELKSQLKNLIMGYQQPSDGQPANGNKKSNEIKSDLNEDDIEAQINALLQNSLINDLENRYTNQNTFQQQCPDFQIKDEQFKQFYLESQ